MTAVRWGRGSAWPKEVSPHLNYDNYRAAAYLVKGYGPLAQMLGYASTSRMQFELTAEHADFLRKLAGPHGAAILAAWRAKRK